MVSLPAVVQYYRTPAVRNRIREYASGSVFISGLVPGHHVRWSDAAFSPVAELDRLLEAGADISRSMWDADSLLFHFDVDYQNPDRPALPFEHPADIFVRIEGVRRTVEDLLAELRLPLLALMTGRGYHWTGRIPLDDPWIARLASLAPVPTWLATHDARRPEWATSRVTAPHARAYTAVGMLVEYMAHEVMRRALRISRIPLVVNGTPVGSGALGRECASLDFSYAGDPLDIRHLRMAFSVYRSADALTDPGVDAPLMVAVPMAGRPTIELLDGCREPEGAAALAASVDTRIPAVTDGVASLVDAYLKSPLAAFHREFYASAADPPERWPQTYDRFDPATLVPCARIALQQPNDLLLKPEFLQHVVRVLMADGWPPRRIAGLVHSKYARDFNWGDRWTRMDAQSRADFNVRVFAGLAAIHLDRGVDFNCRSTQEKGMCPGEPCEHDLRTERDRLLARVP